MVRTSQEPFCPYETLAKALTVRGWRKQQPAARAEIRGGLAGEGGRDGSLLTRQVAPLGAPAADRGHRRTTRDWRGANHIVDVPWHPAPVWDDLQSRCLRHTHLLLEWTMHLRSRLRYAVWTKRSPVPAEPAGGHRNGGERFVRRGRRQEIRLPGLLLV